ncbi:MAG: helix-turn-helix domain-containing protein [Proteobacteria bacterium]|nr:helix-turn-helix domain-containing protein [Pseudomonadota bacterium]
MAVAAHFEAQPAATPRAKRRRLLLQAAAGANGETAAATVHNVSATGILLETSVALEPDERFEVDLPEVGVVAAQVVWRDEGFHGCRFDHDLGGAALGALALRSDPVRPAQPGGAIEHEPFPARLQRLRKQRGLTLAAIGAALGVSKPTVWAWEQGRSRPTPDHLAALARALAVPETELAGTITNPRLPGVLNHARQQIADAMGIDPEKVRILIEP